ncbi:hypothetical protein Nepgr_000544 [Nepenthes gracilis]|uniref:Uncharacterized protein n=1 Tax=Nepenthes gracilis TaxID=150966 RepID=A0AAD3P4M8_NEPGR|nr:hypothetical protein Nepgr_000544 [Nepenthes gracilis]
MDSTGSSANNNAANEDTMMVDHRRNPVDKSRTGGWRAAGLILGCEVSERVCVMGIAMNIVTYMTGDLHLSSSKSANMVTNFMGTLNLLALLGGFLADAKLGRYLTAATFGPITALGMTLLTLATSLPSMRPPSCNDSQQQDNECVEASGQQLAMLYAALYTIALGAGGIKATVSGFGSDQFDITDPKEGKAMMFFFNRFYFCISVGSLFAVTVLIYIQDNVGRGWGYGIAAATMMIAVTVLLFGRRFYRFRKPEGSPLTVIWRVVVVAWRRRSLPYPSNSSFLNDYRNARVPHTNKFKCLDKAAILDDYAAKEENRNNPWLVSTVTQVEEVKMVLKLLPIWSTGILFWTVYSQMTTFTVEQATYMNQNLGSFTVPAGSFTVFLFLSILIFTFLNDTVFCTIARRLTHNVQGITTLQRIGIGLLFSVAAMVAAAIIEKHRREMEVEKNTLISAFWLVPQLFLVGAGEAFAYVGQLEFFIREAPERMKSMSTGLFLSTLSMGFFLSSLLVSIIDGVTKGSWLKSNLNEGKLENFYWMLAVLGVLNFFFFLALAMRHEYKVQQYESQSENGEKELESWNDRVQEENQLQKSGDHSC